MRNGVWEDANVVGVGLSRLDSGADGGDAGWIRVLHLHFNSVDFGRRHRRHALLHTLHGSRRNIAHLILYLRQLLTTTKASEVTRGGRSLGVPVRESCDSTKAKVSEGMDRQE